MKIHRKIRVRGKVQGVYFRAYTQQKALELGVRGIVKNEPDGSVYIEAEGDENSMNSFFSWCKQGPPAAIVKDVESETGELKNYTSFDILK